MLVGEQEVFFPGVWKELAIALISTSAKQSPYIGHRRHNTVHADSGPTADHAKVGKGRAARDILGMTG